MEIADLVKGWTEGWGTAADTFADLFTEDAVYDDVPMGLVHHGRADIDAFHKQFMGI